MVAYGDTALVNFTVVVGTQTAVGFTVPSGVPLPRPSASHSPMATCVRLESASQAEADPWIAFSESFWRQKQTCNQNRLLCGSKEFSDCIKGSGILFCNDAGDLQKV